MTEFDPLVSVLLRVGAGLYLAAMIATAYWAGKALYRWFTAPGPRHVGELLVASKRLQEDSREFSERVAKETAEFARQSAEAVGFGSIATYPHDSWPHGPNPPGLYRD